MKREVLVTLTFTGSTVVVTGFESKDNVMDSKSGEIIAAGSPKAVADTLKERFKEALGRMRYEPLEVETIRVTPVIVSEG